MNTVDFKKKINYSYYFKRTFFIRNKIKYSYKFDFRYDVMNHNRKGKYNYKLVKTLIYLITQV